MIDFDARVTETPEPVELFKLDGRTYTMAQPGANLSLQYLDRLTREPEAVVQAWILRTVIGDEAYEALMAYNGLTAGDLEQLINIVVSETLGQTENTTPPLAGGSTGASPRRKPRPASRTRHGSTGGGRTSTPTS